MARSRGVVQTWPGQLDLLQLAQNLAPEEFNRLFVAGLIRVCLELAVQLTPCEPLRELEREGAVGEPHVEIEAQRAALEGREDVHVKRHRWRMISLKNFSLNSILLAHSVRSSGLFHQNSVRSAITACTVASPFSAL